MDCLDANAVQDLMSGALDTTARAVAVQHLDGCEDCRSLVSLLARDVTRTAAIDTLRDADVLGRQYASVGGGVFGGWEGYITNWHRNLFAGIDVAPEVGPDDCLVVLEDPAVAGRFPGLAFAWMEACGLDRSVALLGIAVVGRAEGEALARAHGSTLRVYEPIMARKVSPQEGPL